MALLIWSAALWGLAYFMGKPAQQQVELPPLDAQLIEQPVPAVPRSIKQERSTPVHQPKQMPQIGPMQSPVKTVQQAELTTTTPVALPATSASSSASHATQGEGNPVLNSGTQAGSHNGSPRGNIYANSGARAIIQPKPQIPDDLREGAFNVTALARFHIAVDGSVKVELVKPTPNPRLNRILLDSLKKWRFMPAIKNGKPVASIEEIVVKIEVK